MIVKRDEVVKYAKIYLRIVQQCDDRKVTLCK